MTLHEKLIKMTQQAIDEAQILKDTNISEANFLLGKVAAYQEIRALLIGNAAEDQVIE